MRLTELNEIIDRYPPSSLEYKSAQRQLNVVYRRLMDNAAMSSRVPPEWLERRTEGLEKPTTPTSVNT